MSFIYSGRMCDSTAPTFFFDEALPSEITPSQDLASLCAESLPTLPVHSLSVESDTSSGGTTYSYCTVDTARGKFRSKSVVTGGTYRFSEFFEEICAQTLANKNSAVRTNTFVN